MLGRVDQPDDHLQEAVSRLAGTRWNDLHIRRSHGLRPSQGGSVNQLLQLLIGLQNPVADQDPGERIYYCAFEADHSIDPFTYSRSLLEVAGIDEIHASRPRCRTVDHHDLAVQAKIGATNQGLEQPDRKRRTKLDTGLAQALRLCTLPPGPRAQSVDQ